MKEEVATAAGDKIIKDTDALTGQDYSSNLTKNLHLFREINARLKAIDPNVFIVGENFDGHAYHVAPYYEGLDSMLNFYMYYNLSQATSMGGHTKYDTWSKAAIVSGANTSGSDTFSEAGLSYGGKWNYNDTFIAYNKYRSEGAATSGEAVDSLFTSNHDVTRAINQSIGWLDNIGEITGPGNVTLANKTLVEKQAIAYMSGIILLPGLSWIYYGDELGLASNLPTGATLQDPNIDRIFRQPMKWDKEGNDSRTTQYSFTGAQTFDVAWDDYNAVLDGVSEQNVDTASMLSRMKKLTALKSATDALKYGSYAPLPLSQYANNKSVFAFKRTLGSDTYNVYISLWHSNISGLNLPGTVVLSLEGASKTTLPAWGVLVTKL
ncbi:MAG: Alpha-amylase precursor [Tenericutes bacterium ADurb.Bin087]|nr:MAG: Alpha-amylase precursor [Tenericutes bacterium ADurb.Bin087]